MPLPPAPSKRAALLNTEAFDAPAKTRQARRPSEQDELIERQAHSPSVEGFDRSGGGELVQELMAPEISQGNAQTSSRKTAPTARVATKPKKAKSTGPTKLFVLDTNVLMHDPMCLYRFEEHDVFLPMIVLEELDSNKKGMTEVARNARQTSRSLDALVAHHQEADITTGIQLSGTGHREVGGRLFFQTQPLNFTLPPSLPQGKADNQILGVVEALRVQYAPRPVVLVSKDINMRVKARALGLLAEDYQNDKTLEDGDLLYSGALALPHDFWIKHAKSVESWQSGSQTFYRLSGPIVPELHINQFVYFESPGEPSLYARVTEIRGKTVVLKTLKDFTHLKNAVWGVTTRNREQNFAMNLLTDPEIDFVTLTGTAGTGKTLMALAAGLDTGIGRSPLHRNHHDARNGQRRRRHWFLARYRRRKNGPLDGRFGRQLRSARQNRNQCRRMGPRGYQ